MFGKIMSISDALMLKYYELLTEEDLGRIKTMHPKEAKLKLAELIIGQYHSPESASSASQEFERVFSKKELPQNIPEYKTTGNETVVNILLKSGLVKSGNEVRRLIKQGAVFFNELKIEKDDFIIKQAGFLKAGPRRFLKIILN
jgi:tyrosyl-tRNA synthetase